MEKKISITVAVLIISLLLVGSSGLSMEKSAGLQTNQPVNTIDNTSREALGLSSIRMITETTGWALGNGNILRTINGSNHWEDITPPGELANFRGTTPEFLDANTAWVATSTENGSKLGSSAYLSMYGQNKKLIYNLSPEKFQTSSAIHGALDHFQPIVITFKKTIAIITDNRILNGYKISDNSICKRFQVFIAAFEIFFYKLF